MAYRPIGDAEQNVDSSESLRLQLAGFLTSPPVFCLGLYYHLKEVVQGGGEGPHGTNPGSYSEAVLRCAFQILGPKHRLFTKTCATMYYMVSETQMAKTLPACFM